MHDQIVQQMSNPKIHSKSTLKFTITAPYIARKWSIVDNESNEKANTKLIHGLIPPNPRNRTTSKNMI